MIVLTSAATLNSPERTVLVDPPEGVYIVLIGYSVDANSNQEVYFLEVTYT
jgi:hypothetical protein